MIAPFVAHLWMIAPVQNIEHDGAGAEIKGYVLADRGVWMTRDRYLIKSALLDCRHANE